MPGSCKKKRCIIEDLSPGRYQISPPLKPIFKFCWQAELFSLLSLRKSELSHFYTEKECYGHTFELS